MKHLKITVATILLCVGLAANAQNFGLQAGFLQTISKEKKGSSSDYSGTDTLSGFKVGIIYEQTIIHGFGFVTGVNYSFVTKQERWGAKNILGVEERTSIMASYISIPIHLQYKFKVAKDTYVSPFIGPEFSYGLSKNKTIYSRNQILGTTFTRHQPYYEIDEDGDGVLDNSRLSIQLSVGMAIQYQNFVIKGGYDFAIMNSKNDHYNNTLINNYKWYGKRGEWNIRVAYMF